MRFANNYQQKERNRFEAEEANSKKVGGFYQKIKDGIEYLVVNGPGGFAWGALCPTRFQKYLRDNVKPFRKLDPYFTCLVPPLIAGMFMFYVGQHQNGFDIGGPKEIIVNRWRGTTITKYVSTLDQVLPVDIPYGLPPEVWTPISYYFLIASIARGISILGPWKRPIGDPVIEGVSEFIYELHRRTYKSELERKEKQRTEVELLNQKMTHAERKQLEVDLANYSRIIHDEPDRKEEFTDEIALKLARLGRTGPVSHDLEDIILEVPE